MELGRKACVKVTPKCSQENQWGSEERVWKRRGWHTSSQALPHPTGTQVLTVSPVPQEMSVISAVEIAGTFSHTVASPDSWGNSSQWLLPPTTPPLRFPLCPKQETAWGLCTSEWDPNKMQGLKGSSKAYFINIETWACLSNNPQPPESLPPTFCLSRPRFSVWKRNDFNLRALIYGGVVPVIFQSR